jgi:hypothetical protein
VDEEIVRLLLTKLLEWIGPEDVAHEAVGRWLAETVNLPRLVMVLEREQFHIRSSNHPEYVAQDSIRRVCTRTACS